MWARLCSVKGVYGCMCNISSVPDAGEPSRYAETMYHRQLVRTECLEKSYTQVMLLVTLCILLYTPGSGHQGT